MSTPASRPKRLARNSTRATPSWGSKIEAKPIPKRPIASRPRRVDLAQRRERVEARLVETRAVIFDGHPFRADPKFDARVAPPSDGVEGVRVQLAEREKRIFELIGRQDAQHAVGVRAIQGPTGRHRPGGGRLGSDHFERLELVVR